MNRFFRMLPLPVKLILIGLVPFIVLVFLSFQLYSEKKERITLLENYREGNDQSTEIFAVITNLQDERKYSYDKAVKKVMIAELTMQRANTDSAIRQLLKSKDTSLNGFTSYTFLDNLQKIRGQIDNNALTYQQVNSYYNRTISRISSLSVSFPGSDIYFLPLNKDLASQKSLMRMITSLGNIRANIYNILSQKNYLTDTQGGLSNSYDLYKSYETEFLLKGAPVSIAGYNNTRNYGTLKATINFIEQLIAIPKFDSNYLPLKSDSAYLPLRWWQVSEQGTDELKKLHRQTSDNLTANMADLLKTEKAKKDKDLGLLLIVLLLVVCIVTYTIYHINIMLKELKLAAQAISSGITGISITPSAKDAIGSLTWSILKMDSNNKLLSETAEKIGNGNFNVTVHPRSKDDMLGNSLLKMKDNLLNFSRENEGAQEQLRQMADKYRTIFYKSPLAKWIFDGDTLRFLEVNDAAINLYGYSREEFLSKTIADIRPVTDRDKFFRHITEVKTVSDDNTSNWQHIKKNGEIIQVEVTAHVIDYDGRKARMIIVRDITERKKAEAEILSLHEDVMKSEQKFRAMIENNNEIIALTDNRLRTFYRSPSSERITGWSDAERDAMDSIDIVHPDDKERIQHIYDTVLATPGKSIPISHRYLHKKGHYIWLEGQMMNMLHDPSIKGIITNFKDVTERKIAEEKLIKSEKIYKTIASSIPGSVICLLDHEYRYLLIEGDMLHRLGYSREMLLYKKAKDILTPDRFEGVRLNLEAAFRGETSSMEINRDDLNFITRFVPLKDENNEVYATMTVGIDITELKRAERHIQELNVGLEQKVAERTSQLEIVNKELEAFTYSVSHDLRAPLRIIDGFSDILASDYAGNFDAEGTRVLAVIKNNAQRMGRLIDDLLNLSRLGRKKVAVSHVDMNQLVQEVIDEQRLLSPNVVKIDKDDLLSEYCDPNLITQVWSNLISNAIKYSSKSLHPQVIISSYKQGDEVVYFIKDNGVGFDMEYAGKLFGVFQRLHKAKDFEGTGVGLALVQRIVEKHGGKVWAEAAINHGASFFFSLPIHISIPNKNNDYATEPG